MNHSNIYQATKSSHISNTVVKELNACVLTATFPGKGIFNADLYKNKNSADCLVLAGSCAPIHGKYITTIKIEIS